MTLEPELVHAMFATHGIQGPWEALPSTGVANRIFATQHVVLRVATDHPDAVADARTESVAAPVVRAAGIRTPRLIAFDDTRTLADRPFSLWERVHGETLGLTRLSFSQTTAVWRAVGRELARLHRRVETCPDPDGYLDEPDRDQDVETVMKRLVDARRLDVDAARSVERLAGELRPLATPGLERRFVHDDIHPMNVMCSPDGELLAIIDWGDAGWSDPTLDFSAIPLDGVRPALEGYEAEVPGALGARPEARIAWNRLIDALDDLWAHPDTRLNVEALRHLARPRR